MKVTSFIALLMLTLGIYAGCATQPPMYHWGSYSSSLYQLKKNPTPENLENHKLILRKIIDDSQQQGMRVPPGVYCEYGYILLKEGQRDEAIKYLALEEETYPESAVFIQRLRSHATNGKE